MAVLVNVNLDALRCRPEAKDQISAPIDAGDVLATETNLLVKSPARGLNNRAFDLIVDPSGLIGCPLSIAATKESLKAMPDSRA